MPDAVALADAERLEDVGELLHLAVQVPVRERAPVARFALPDDGGLVARGAADVPVDAVGGDVQRAAAEPRGVWRLPVEHLFERRDPLESARHLLPVRVRIALGLGRDVRAADECAGTERLRGREGPGFRQEDVDVGHVGGGWQRADGRRQISETVTPNARWTQGTSAGRRAARVTHVSLPRSGAAATRRAPIPRGGAS